MAILSKIASELCSSQWREMFMKKLGILVIGLMLVAAACNKKTDTDTNMNDNSNNTAPYDSSKETQPTETTGTTAPPLKAPTTIKMTAAGFEPANVTIKKGDTVVFLNNDSKPHWPASAQHPTHTALPGFDSLKAVAAGASYSYTFTKAGTWGYHDHLNASFFGKVTATE